MWSGEAYISHRFDSYYYFYPILRMNMGNFGGETAFRDAGSDSLGTELLAKNDKPEDGGGRGFRSRGGSRSFWRAFLRRVLITYR